MKSNIEERSQTIRQSVGVIGLGMIGAAVTKKLLGKGFPTKVFDVRPDAILEIEPAPSMSPSPGEAAHGADVIIIAVVDAGQARSVLTAKDGVLSSCKKGSVVVLLSTVDLAVVDEFTELTKAAGVHFVDCGVTVDYTSDNPGIVCLTGGDASIIDNVRPVLEGFSKLVLHFGQTGAGMKAKIARNVINYGFWRIAYEAGRLADEAGLDLRKLVQAIRAGDPKGEYGTAWLERRGTIHQLAEDDPQRDFFIHLATLQRKDLKAAIDLGKTMNVDLPCTRITLETTDAILGLAEAK